jgi:uncharacterized protein
MPTHDHESVTRRQFLQTGSAIAAGTALVGSAAAPADESKPGMKYRRFGRTNLMLSAIGLGCASGLRSQQLGPALFNRYREELPAIVNKLLERGGNFVATAAGYHDTEEILGRTLHGRRQEVTIFTGSNSPDVKRVRAECERSLVRFQTDVIDCYFAWSGWSEGFHEAASALKKQGKIRFIGMSCHVPAKHRPHVEAGEVDFVFQPYNYMNLAKWTEQVDRPGAEELFELCKKKDVGVLVIKPMTGHFIPNWAKNAADPKVAGLIDELNRLGTKNLYQAFLMWVLKNPNVCCTAVGMNAVQDVIEDCEAVAQKLTSEHRRLLDLYAAAATGDYCRMCETCLEACPAGVRIADILRFRMYYKNYGHWADAREFYADLAKHQQATACIECGRCQQACPNKLAIVEKLKEAHRLLA